MKKNILVFPCGSEVALEIHRSLKFSTHFHLVGASSIEDHGHYIFEDYIGNLPFYTDENFIDCLKSIVEKLNIDAIYPAMDAVAKTLKDNESKVGCHVIGSQVDAVATAASKIATYKLLSEYIPCPKWTTKIDNIQNYPVFIKPDEGYGSRNVKLALNKENLVSFIRDKDINFVYCEYLPGVEYTIDCFTDRKGNLLFNGARERARISNGISVSTKLAKKHIEFFNDIANKINSILRPRGAWFFQMKENADGQPVLLEVATRLGGSSSYFRAKGVNFAMLSAFDAFNVDVSLEVNDYDVLLDRALSNKYKISVSYKSVYVDFDDCIYIDNKVNTQIIEFLYQAINDNKKIFLITRHAGLINEKLLELKIAQIFDDVIHITNTEAKSKYIDCALEPIFIDDSYAERKTVRDHLNIPVFSPDMIEILLK